MAAIHLLIDKFVQEASDGDHADGGGLSLRINGNSGKWLYRDTSSEAYELERQCRMGTSFGCMPSLNPLRIPSASAT
jgi:hypothetical protein